MNNENNVGYVYGLDLSMSSTGIAIFKNNIPVFIGSIPTSDKLTHGKRLQIIYEYLLNLKNEFPPEIVAIERGFNRFNISTAVLYRVHGVVNFLFADISQIYYTPKTIKSVLISGTAKKIDIFNKIVSMFPFIEFNNNDETDACAIALTYLIKERGFDFGK